METIGDRKFLQLPGDRTHELPPLLVRSAPKLSRLDKVVDMASHLVEDEALIPNVGSLDQRMDLALQLVEQYKTLMHHWRWGDSVLEWIRQCELTFESHPQLRPLLRPDVWPHAGRTSFVTLLMDKHVPLGGVTLDHAVGLRLTFRQPPPLACFSDQFLFYLKSNLAKTAYDTWASMTPEPCSSLPPERFSFQVVDMQ